MTGNEYLVNRHILNGVMSTEELSNNSIAVQLASILDCEVKAMSVRIGSIRKGETLATDEIFLRELEKTLKLKKGSLFGDAITKTELQRMKRLKERKLREVSFRLSQLISIDSRKKTVQVEKEFLCEIRELL